MLLVLLVLLVLLLLLHALRLRVACGRVPVSPSAVRVRCSVRAAVCALHKQRPDLSPSLWQQSSQAGLWLGHTSRTQPQAGAASHSLVFV